jgi:hypothetical protein
MVKNFDTIHDLERGSKPIGEILEKRDKPVKIEEPSQPTWLELAFVRAGKSHFVYGVFMLFVLIEVPRLLIVFSIFENKTLLSVEFLSAGGDLVIPISLLLLWTLHRSMDNALTEVSAHLENSRVRVAPRWKPNVKDRSGSFETEVISRYYHGPFVELLNGGCEIAFARTYQISLGIGAFLLSTFLRLAGFIPSASMLGISVFLQTFDYYYSTVTTGLVWAVTAMIIWSVGICVLLCALIGSGVVVEFHPSTSLKSCYEHVTGLAVKAALVVGVLASILIPVFYYGILQAQFTGTLAEIIAGVFFGVSILLVLVVLSVSVYFVHKGMRLSKERKIASLQASVDRLQGQIEHSNYRSVPVGYQYLLQQLKDADSQPEWPISLISAANAVVALVVPTLSFLASLIFVK